MSGYFVAPFSGWSGELSDDAGHVGLSPRLREFYIWLWLERVRICEELCRERRDIEMDTIALAATAGAGDGGKIELCSNLTT